MFLSVNRCFLLAMKSYAFSGPIFRTLLRRMSEIKLWNKYEAMMEARAVEELIAGQRLAVLHQRVSDIKRQGATKVSLSDFCFIELCRLLRYHQS